MVYEVNFKAYSPTRNLQAVIDRPDDLDSLEVNVIWLMPIYPEGQVNAVGSPLLQIIPRSILTWAI